MFESKQSIYVMHAQLTSSQIAADAAAATLSMLAGPAALGPTPGPQRLLLGQPAQGSLASTPPGLPARPPSPASQGLPAPWSRQLTKESLLKIIANSFSDSTYGLTNSPSTLARKLRELTKYLATLLPAENQTTSLVLAFTNKAAMLEHLAQMPPSNRHLGTTAFKNVLDILQVKGPPANHPLFWEIHRVIPRLLHATQAKAAATYRRQLNGKKLAGVNEDATSKVTFQAVKEAVRRIGHERFDLLVRAASSWFHEVRMEESQAEQLFSELSAGIPHHINRAYPLLTRSQEDAKLFGEIAAAPAAEPKTKTDHAGIILR